MNVVLRAVRKKAGLAALGLASLGGALALVTSPVSAQAPDPAAAPIPSYARADERIDGTVSSVAGRTIFVRDARGYLDRVELHDGTIINPRGLKLAAGQTVTIHGVTRGPVFSADEIDTPYHRTYAYAPIVYYPYGPYPYYYGYPYAYGPAYSLRVGFRFR